MSDFELGMVHRADIKYQVADALSRLKANEEDQTLLDDEVQVLTIPYKIFACAARTETTEFELIEEIKGPFVFFILHVCMMAGITDINKEIVSAAAEVIPAQSTDRDCHPAFVSVGKPSTHFDDYSAGILGRVFSFDSASKRVVKFSLFPSYFQFRHYLLFASSPDEPRTTTL